MHESLPAPAINPMQQREVTLLFADLRGFTQVASTLGTAPLFCELLANLMDCLTEAVIEHKGHIIDYYGDGLAAMWNAPTAQPHHAELACGAGLQMLAALPTIAAEWRHLLQSDLQLGIGVHTGSVQIGNAGSTQRAKYGARGPNVHLASRVESATKEVRVPLLATGATVEKLSESFRVDRVCRVQLPGLQEPVELFAVGQLASDREIVDAWQSYDCALAHFERGQFQDAANLLAQIDASLAVPVQFLAERAAQELGSGLRRRSTDKPATLPDGIVTLAHK